MTRSVSLPQIDEALALVCSIPAAGRGQRRVDLTSVIEHTTDVRKIEHGVALTFDGSAETARLIADFVLAERDCCAQFNYTIRFAPHAAAVELSITASAAQVQPLRDLYLGIAQVKPHV